MEIKNFGKIGVLMGGPSSEREISLKSGKAVFSALCASGVDAVAIDITTEDPQENLDLLKQFNLDGVFIALHGRFGEDGAIQSILEELDLPYTASGVEASRLAMDKIGSLKIFSQGGLCVPKSQFLEKTSYLKNRKFINQLGFPLVVKPANHGSSIGLSLIDNADQLPEAMELAFQYDEHIIIQQYLSGKELTVGILGEAALPVIEIVPHSKFYDFAAKYQDHSTQYIVPAVLEKDLAAKIQSAAVKAHKLLGCYGCSRVDFILTEKLLPFILEVNTIPGMTSTSLLPKAAKASGIDFNQLCLKLLELAYEKAKV
ncbi:MAG TPA: D-alanine--D-alanine ligase [Candidatus Omnitrophota bacterium]|nr:D-alanine--D-alanine ligase [Candidatus Omnitrophota bacterium]HPT39800.1 D-alanine--D-alanine ligase [Candidatus Omnitrophota bacterium]